MHRVTGGDPLLFEARENVLGALVTLSMASSIDQSSCLSPNIMVPMKLFKPDNMRGFQNIINIGQIYGIVTNKMNVW